MTNNIIVHNDDTYMLKDNISLNDDNFCYQCKQNSLVERYSYETFEKTKNIKIKIYYSICTLCDIEMITTNQIIKNEKLINLIKLLMNEGLID